MVGGVTLVGGNGSELTRLPGGAELNILPANGVFRSVKAQPLAVQGGDYQFTCFTYLFLLSITIYIDNFCIIYIYLFECE